MYIFSYLKLHQFYLLSLQLVFEVIVLGKGRPSQILLLQLEFTALEKCEVNSRLLEQMLALQHCRGIIKPERPSTGAETFYEQYCYWL